MKAFLTIISIAMLFAVACGDKVSLNDAEVARLKLLINSDASAATLYKNLKTVADKALTQTPNPIAVYKSAGLLDGDSVKTASAKAAQDYDKIYALAFTYKVNGSVSYLNKLIEFLTAWAAINTSEGAPVDDRLMDQVIEAFDLCRKDFSSAVLSSVKKWFQQFANQEMYNSQVQPGQGTGTNNWNSNRLMVIGYIGVVLKDDSIIDWTTKALDAFLPTNLYSDGTGFDFKQRDAIHYHVFNLEPLIQLATVLNRQGLKNYYTYVLSNGGSIQKSVNWMTPYITGQKTHAEYVKSTVPFDKERANNGQSDYAVGHPWVPTESVSATGPATYFDSSLISLVQTAAKSTATYPTWDCVIAAVMRGSATVQAS